MCVYLLIDEKEYSNQKMVPISLLCGGRGKNNLFNVQQFQFCKIDEFGVLFHYEYTQYYLIVYLKEDGKFYIVCVLPQLKEEA